MGGGGGGTIDPDLQWSPGMNLDEFDNDFIKIIVDFIESNGGQIYEINQWYSDEEVYEINFMYEFSQISISLENNVDINNLEINSKELKIGKLTLDHLFEKINDYIGIPNKVPVGKSKEIIPVSGGMDSALLAFLYPDAKCVYFDYGQKFKDIELKALDSMGIQYKFIKIRKQKVDKSGVFQNRNFAFFIKLRELYINYDLIIYFGNNLSDEHPIILDGGSVITDNNIRSIRTASRAIDQMYIGGTFQIKSPLIKYDKPKISEELIQYIPDDAFVVWCENSNSTPCGECFKCKQMKQYGLFDEWAKRFPKNY